MNCTQTCDQGRRCTCKPYTLNTVNSDGSDPHGWLGRMECMAFTGIRIVAVLIIAASLVGLGVGLRSVGWL